MASRRYLVFYLRFSIYKMLCMSRLTFSYFVDFFLDFLHQKVLFSVIWRLLDEKQGVIGKFYNQIKCGTLL
jgi:hypothetical protein